MAQNIKVARFSAVGEPSPNSGKYVLYGVIALVLVLVGFAIGKTTTSSKTAPSTINATKNTPLGQGLSAYGPKRVDGIVPAGFTHNTQGAIAAATAYIGTIKQLYYANEDAFNTSVVQITTPGFTQDFIEGISETRVAARAAYATDPELYFREFLLGYFVEAEAPDEVTVVVWSGVMVAARPDFNGKTESKIHNVTVSWEGKDWKVSNWSTSPGPVPQWQAPSSSIVSIDDFLEFTQPFTGGYDYVPSF